MEDHFKHKEETYSIIGAAMEVHKYLGCGFVESIYHEALCKELALRNIHYNQEVELVIEYKDCKLNKKFRADLICYDKIIVELKACSQLHPEHEKQILNYLKATNLEVGLLINFGETSLVHKRFINKYYIDNK